MSIVQKECYKQQWKSLKIVGYNWKKFVFSTLTTIILQSIGSDFMKFLQHHLKQVKFNILRFDLNFFFFLILKIVEEMVVFNSLGEKNGCGPSGVKGTHTN